MAAVTDTVFSRQNKKQCSHCVKEGMTDRQENRLWHNNTITVIGTLSLEGVNLQTLLTI